MARAFADIAFTPTVRAMQDRMGSADDYAPYLEPDVAPHDALGPKEAAFIQARDGFCQATVSAEGWPYVQFRGGPKGFLRVIDEKTIAFADFRGNRQYLSAGNLLDSDKIAMILMDYAHRRRLKLWGRAKLIDSADNPDLVAKLHVEGYRAQPERAVVITIAAFDWNCPQHITRRWSEDELAAIAEKSEA